MKCHPLIISANPNACGRTPLAAILLGCSLAFVVGVVAQAGNARGADWQPIVSSAHDLEIKSVDSVWQLRTTGGDPYLVGNWKGPRAANETILEIEYICVSGIGSLSAYYGPPISAATQVSLPELPAAEGWHRYSVNLAELAPEAIANRATRLRLDFGQIAGVDLQLRQIRLRTPTQAERRSQLEQQRLREEKQSVADRIEEYLNTSFPCQPQVTIENQHVLIRYEATDLSLSPQQVELIEFPPFHRPIASPDPVTPNQVEFDGDGSNWTQKVPRYANGMDRLHSGWRLRLKQDGTYLSARRFVSKYSVGSMEQDFPQRFPKSQKGLSGFSSRGPQQDLIDLGIHGVTINLVLSRFIAHGPATGRQRIEVEGADVYFNPAAFAIYDPLLRFAREHDIVVSAIVLIPRSQKPVASPTLVHPQADGGVYAMPDIDSKRGTQIYSHVLREIARRYNGSDDSPGAIDNWIAHNEVDYHTVWTNMGLQPRGTYIETYYRSLRMIHQSARQFHPHARVFASLTHHWNVPDEGRWNRLSPRDCLRALQDYCRLEGDFSWGVAYHPYPESLFAKVAWQDNNVTDDFDTPMITMQNLEVLGRFLQQPSMRDADGNLRPVILSEQGYHTTSDAPEDQSWQAGSLLYALDRVRQMPWIETFHYHRWIDHPHEGGLRLGLRGFPSETDRFGAKKKSWFLYQAIGTDQEAEFRATLPAPK